MAASRDLRRIVRLPRDPLVPARHFSANPQPQIIAASSSSADLASSSRKHHGKCWTREFPLSHREEEDAWKLRKIISGHRSRTVEELAGDLRIDPSCAGIELSPCLFDCLLHRFGDDWKSALALFKWASSCDGYKHSSDGYVKMVDLLGKMKQFDRMWSVALEMRDSGIFSAIAAAKIMRRLAGAGRWRDAIEVFDELPQLGIARDTDSMNILLDTLCKETKVEVAREVFLDLKANIAPNAYTFNIFVHGWCVVRRMDETLWTIEEMRGYGYEPSVITYSIVLQVYCNQLDYVKVHDLLDKMHSGGCPPNIVTYTAIMNSYAKSNEIEEAINIFERLPSSGCMPDTLFYNSLINILGRAGRLPEALQDALDVLRKLEEDDRMKPDLDTYTPLLQMCFRTWENDDGGKLHSLLSDIVDKHHVSLDVARYSLLIRGLCSVGLVDWACLLFDEMVAREIRPNRRICKLLAENADGRNMYEAAETIREVMKQL